MSTDKTTQALSKQPEQTAAVHEVGDRPVLAPPVDIFENEHEYRVLADLPGVAKQDVGLDLDKGELSDELQKEGLSAEEADCAAGALIDADFSREEVDKLAANDTNGVDADKVDEFTAALSECIGIPDLTTDTGN